MVLLDTSWEDNFLFYFHNEIFSLWQNFLFSMWSITTCYVKVAQLVQSLASTWLAYSFNHPFLIPTQEITTQLIENSNCIAPWPKNPISILWLLVASFPRFSISRSHASMSTNHPLHIMVSLLNKQIMVCGSEQECCMECTKDHCYNWS